MRKNDREKGKSSGDFGKRDEAKRVIEPTEKITSRERKRLDSVDASLTGLRGRNGGNERKLELERKGRTRRIKETRAKDSEGKKREGEKRAGGEAGGRQNNDNNKSLVALAAGFAGGGRDGAD